MKARLRGHHLICLNFFRGEGYSEDFVRNIYSVIGRESIEIVSGPDEVCMRCPYLKNDKCSSNEYTDDKIMHQDREALKLLGFRSGMVIDWMMISARLPLVLEKWKEEFCTGCGYQETCARSSGFHSSLVRQKIHSERGRQYSGAHSSEQPAQGSNKSPTINNL